MTEATEPETTEDGTTAEEPDSFPRKYVEQLRAEAAEHRTKARDHGARADLLAERLLAQTVTTVAANTLADPSDLLELTDHGEFLDEETGLPDVDRIGAAATQLVERKPHLARRRAAGSIEQGARTPEPAGVDLADMLRQAAT